jgi:hypothetical protein
MPKIWADLAGNLTGTTFCDIIADPGLALRVIVEAGLAVGADAVRQFHFPPRLTERAEGRVYEINRDGKRLGEIDIAGGWATHLVDAHTFHLEDPYAIVYHQYWPSWGEPHVSGLEDARRIAVPPKSFYEEIGCGKQQRNIMQLAGDRMALAGDLTSATMAFHVCMRGMTEAMIDLIDAPELVHAVMDKGAEIAIERGKFLTDLGLKVLRLNDSVGNMSLISPTAWRTFVFPRMKLICDELHHYDRTTRIYCHICGNVTPILEGLVATGLDCIGPLDPLGGMNAGEVRQRVGDRVSLMGGVDTLALLRKTPTEVETDARNCIVGAGVKGGYILGSGCVVPRAAPAENLLALRRAAERYGTYKEGKLISAL